jgi:FkbM family methyltransferase
VTTTARDLLKLPGVVPVRINGTDRLVLPFSLRRLRQYEPEVWNSFLSQVTAGDLFVDVGANLGLYAIAAAKRGARVVAFEPDPNVARQLRWLARFNRVKVRTVQALVGSQPGTAPLAMRSSPVSGNTDLQLAPRTRYAAVPVVPLDDVLVGEHVTVLKIDVEGAELEVLQGARRILQTVRVLLVELHPDALSLRGHNVDDVAELLAQSGLHRSRLPEARSSQRWLLTRSHPEDQGD